MIIFYTQNKNVKTNLKSKQADRINTIPQKLASKKVLPVSICDAVCSSNCIKPKSSCCNKYQKKGINCKRCPLTFDIKIAY